jgi:hypothetical protein
MIVNPNSLLALNQLSSIIRATDKVALVVDTDYSVLDNSFLDATVVSEKELSLDTALEIDQGAGIIVKVGNYNFKHIVDNIDSTNTKMLLKRDLVDKDNVLVESGSVEVKREDNITIRFLDLAEGHYIIKPSNLKVVVRESYVQPYVTFAELSAKILDVQNLTESRVSSLNSLALKMIYSDLSGFDNYYDIIDEVDMWKLLFLKIECLLSSDYEIVKEGAETPCDAYKRELNLYRPTEKFTEGNDGVSTGEIEAVISSARYSL